MPADTVRIDCLQLHVPGITKHEAGRLGADVVAWVKRHWQDHVQPGDASARHWHALNVRVEIAVTTPTSHLVEKIGRQICESLR